jgi:hypothetical protein
LTKGDKHACRLLPAIEQQIESNQLFQEDSTMIPLDTFLVLFCVAFGLGFIFGIRYAQRRK